jgi:hypothetical protein
MTWQKNMCERRLVPALSWALASRLALSKYGQRTDFLFAVRHIVEWEPVIERMMAGHKPRHQSQL